MKLGKLLSHVLKKTDLAMLLSAGIISFLKIQTDIMFVACLSAGEKTL